MLNEQAVIDEFRLAMRQKGIAITSDIEADGKLHRAHVEGDKAGTRNAFYILHFDEKPAGQFGCNKLFGPEAKFSWTGESEPMTPEERRAFAKSMDAKRKARAEKERVTREAAAARAQAIWDASKDCTAHPYLKRKGVRSYGLRWGRWEKINHETGEVFVATEHALLVPIRDAKKRIHSLQAIYKAPINGRDKDFLKDGQKEALFFSIGKPLDVEFRGATRQVIVIGEGYATLASIHEATGHACIVAFDAGNLLPVGKVIRERFPDALLIFAGDNDQWTLEPINNPGLTKAKAAAAALDGLVAWPEFPVDAEGRPTDFNDLHALHGLEAVRELVDLALADLPAEEPQPVAAIDPEEPPAAATAEPDDAGSGIIDAPPVEELDPDLPENNLHFAILGYDHERYYIFQHKKRQIATITKGDMSEKGLIELAPLNWWETTYPGGKNTSIDTSAACNFLIRTAEKRGIYDISRVRGRGAWVDAGRMVYHHGSYLTVDGQPTDITAIRSKYVYELDQSLPDPAAEPLESEEGEELLELAAMFRWTKPGSAALLVGWIALAALCGALKWRPHVWLTGGAGCGKSTVLNFVHELLAGIDLYAQGNSSEAGIRQTLRADARPVLFDESESNEETDARRIQNVLSLIRQSSTESEAQTLKGSAGGEATRFHIRSMFCLASIQVAIKHQADVERLAVLSLRPKRDDADVAGSWQRLKAKMYDVQRDTTLPGRLFRRALDLLPITLKNINTFTGAAAKRFNSQRDGDQYGTLLAGAWSLISTQLATEADAFQMIDRYDWSEHRENNDMDEGQQALATLMESHIRVHGGIELSVFELVAAACDRSTEQISSEKADGFLQRHGMKIEKNRLLLSNTSEELRKLVAQTKFASDLRGVLLRVEGATRNDNLAARFSGVASKCISLPLDAVLEGLPNGAPF